MVNSPVFRLFCAALLALTLLGSGRATPLQEYVDAVDEAYGYQVVGSFDGPGFTAYFLDLTSQRWRSEAEVSPTLWRHWLTVIVPDTLVTSRAHLFLFGGSIRPTPPELTELGAFAQIAMATGAVLVALEQVPGQPLQFADEPTPLREDALVAYSWHKTLRTGDPTWAAYLPMTKAAVRAMDAAQDFGAAALGFAPSDFIVTGASKRGAAAWLTAAVDPRVSAVAPAVFNALGLADEIERGFEAYGDYPAAVRDYVERGVLQALRSPEGRFLQTIVDPLSYAGALDMPHYIVNATGDEFFRPDASQRYVDQIPGEVLQRLLPNTNHGLDGQFDQALLGLTAWYQSLILGLPRPVIEWQALPGSLAVRSDQAPVGVRLWQAHNPDGLIRAPTPAPASGYSAYFVELVYPGAGGIPQVYSTPVFFNPDTRPHRLSDPVLQPRRAAQWRLQVAAALGDRPADWDRSALRALLPVRVLGRYLNTPEDLDRALRAEHGRNGGAWRECTAARLNQAAGQLGWYSDADIGGHDGALFWQVYRDAEAAAGRGRPQRAARLCRGLNRLGN